MYLSVVPRLQKIILLKFAARACSAPEIKLLIESRDTILDDSGIDKLKRVVDSFHLPAILHHTLFSLMKPVMIEITSWIFYIRHIHDEVEEVTDSRCACLNAIDLQENLRWKTVGLIDRYLTSLELIRDERLDPAFRFVLACNCCSEVDILRLWWVLSSKVRSTISRIEFLPIVRYWTHRLSKAGEHDESIPMPAFPCEFKFEYGYHYTDAMFSFYAKLPCEVQNYLFGSFGGSIDNLRMEVSDYLSDEENENRVTIGLVNVDNVAALKYFLLTFQPMKGSLFLEVVTRNHFISNELLVFCLSKMRDHQVRSLFQSGWGGRMLSCLANSPWQESLWTFIKYYKRDITRPDIVGLLDYMNFKLKDGSWQDYDYESDAKALSVIHSSANKKNGN